MRASAPRRQPQQQFVGGGYGGRGAGAGGGGAGSARQGEPVKHLVSLGCRCSQAATFKVLQQRRYACPFDWIFSSARMVTHCLRDDFATFLDRSQYFLHATVFDSIGLPPGSAPRDRKLIGHHVYSEMTEGVGRGSIFNHKDPLHSDEDYTYTQRTVERFRHVLATGDRKMFAVMNLNKQLWIESDIRELFDELCKRTNNFVLVAVNCIRNLGERARSFDVELSSREERHGAELLLYRFPCVGDNTGSYFRDDFDASRIRSVLVEPFRFALADDPLIQAWAPPASVPAWEQRQQPQRPQQPAQQSRGCWERGRRGAAAAWRSPGEATLGAGGEADAAADEEASTVADTLELASRASVEDEPPAAKDAEGSLAPAAPKPVRRWASRRAAAA